MPMATAYKLFIDGQWADSSDGTSKNVMIDFSDERRDPFAIKA
jgi:hypothetical protein